MGAEYDPEQVFRDSFGIFLDRPVRSVVLRLHARWRTYAETHTWHESQAVHAGQGGIEVRLRVGLCPELEAWILGFGEQAEVLAPKELRDRVRARIETARDAYAR